MKKLIVLFIILIFGYLSFQYYISLKFGEAALKTAIAITEIKHDLEKDSINLIDSLELKISNRQINNSSVASKSQKK